MSEAALREFRAQAREWLHANSTPLPRTDSAEAAWGTGSDDVSVFHNLSHDDERALLDRLRQWQRRKFEAGYGALEWPEEFGGRGLPPEFEEAFAEEERAFDTGGMHELLSVTVRLIAPTIRLLGTAEQRQRFIGPLLSGAELACQLFSEPGAGSDLAALGTRAVRDGDAWIVNGQKVWTSGAQFAQWGELIARTDPDVPKHQGMTAFLVPLELPGIRVRPLRQMSGGTSFNEVFFDDVRIPDSLRLGEVGHGWQAALTTLGFERGASSANTGVGGSCAQAMALARHTGADRDPLLRRKLAEVIIADRLADIARARDEQAQRNGEPLGALGSIRKMQWVRRMSGISEFVTAALGPRLVVDSGEWGTYAWGQHVLGAPGYRIAGGSDEIQRNIIAERWLGLPPEPRADRGTAWRDLPR
ncbi:acyl-CoA dehydrogenase family protein [Nocardia sp. CA2R105]|uniref:acyl-CoA dehydrogenase family protein n=1 Tax=Nocardia coffeae TaxID=2873381 RepID=UPI001CA71462|nr:acyl-CoA dehydrogenase family protein [Nocardia coffeae]MBY8857120.1 acyl-CoA dehydrogenase family protein [Nocardia coffeae]